MPSSRGFPADTLLIYDRILDRKSEAFKKWKRNFKYRWAVPSGEKTKSLDFISKNLARVFYQIENISSRKMTILVVGGGTLTDFGGFLASILKRGVRLEIIPSTWLAAVDSAHGGKNALNVGGFKNQIGTFYFPQKIYIVRDLLEIQKQKTADQALGELVKMFLLSKSPQLSLKKLYSVHFDLLPAVVDEKYKFVKQDPFEEKKIRYFLNLGHTTAHAFEKIHGLPHGEAVLYGVLFSLVWSQHLGFMSKAEYDRIFLSPFWEQNVNVETYKKLLRSPPQKLRSALLQDKKKNQAGLVHEVFLKKKGSPFLHLVSIQDFLKEFARQKRAL